MELFVDRWGELRQVHAYKLFISGRRVHLQAFVLSVFYFERQTRKSNLQKH